MIVTISSESFTQAIKSFNDFSSLDATDIDERLDVLRTGLGIEDDVLVMIREQDFEAPASVYMGVILGLLAASFEQS